MILPNYLVRSFREINPDHAVNLNQNHATLFIKTFDSYTNPKPNMPKMGHSLGAHDYELP